jgi:hypothetical protein
MSGLDHEKAFEEYLSRRSSIAGRAEDSDGLEPPPELDRIVLANAREAIRIRSAPRPYRSVRWALPVALAATVVLSFAVLLHLGLLPRPGKDSGPEIEAHFHPGGGESGQSAADTAMAAPAPMTEPAQPMLEAPALTDAPKARLRKEEIPQEKSRSAVVDSRPMQAQSAAEQDTKAAVAAHPSADRNQEMAGAISGKLEDPAAWFRRIEALRAQGKTAEADREWQAFRRAWPDFPVKEAPPR